MTWAQVKQSLNSIHSLVQDEKNNVDQKEDQLNLREKLINETELLLQEKENLDDIVHLNIGGYFYSTTKYVITSKPESLLAVMFSKKWENSLVRDEFGRVFIDRDGKPFRFILRHLRGEKLIEPDKNDPEYTYLLESAKYFQINDLVNILETFQGVRKIVFKWDGTLSPGAMVTGDGYTVCGKNSVTSNTPIENGVHSWDVHIDNYSNGWVGVGVTTSVEEENWGGYSYNVWGYSANGYTWSAGKRSIAESYGTDDVITVEVDCKRKQITFKKNGEIVSALMLTKIPVFPIARCNNDKESITLVN